MKQFIVLIAMIGLGIFIYAIIAGPGDNTIKAGLEISWEECIKMRSIYVQEIP